MEIKYPIIAAAVLIAVTALLVSPTSGTILKVDFGNEGQIVPWDWEEASCVTQGSWIYDCSADNSLRSITTLPSHTDSTSFGTVTHSIVSSSDQIDYRDRQGNYSGGQAFYDDPKYGPIGQVIQDAIKCDSCTHDLVFTGLNAGPYELTTYHHSWITIPYDWSDFDLQLEIGAESGFSTVVSNLSVSHSNNPVDPTTHMTSFTSPGPDSQISLRIAPIADTADGTGKAGSMKGRDEVPLNGFILEYTGSLLGDVNADGTVDNLDITPFIAALAAADEADFLFAFPNGNYAAADIDSSGAPDNLDITPFISLLTAGNSAAVPEPTSAILLLLPLMAARRARRTCG